MKHKVILCIACIFILFMFYNYTFSDKQFLESNIEVVDEIEIDDSSFTNNPAREESKEYNKINSIKIINPYFYSDEEINLTSISTYNTLDSGITHEKKLDLKIKFIKSYALGDVFKLSFYPQESIHYLDDARTNIYLYVTSKEIYRLWSYVFQDGGIVSFYNDDLLLTEILDTDEKLINNSVVICQEQPLKIEPDLTEENGGTYTDIQIDNNIISYRSYTVKPNGETDFYERFTWEKRKGLIAYGSGYRAEADILYLDNIMPVD